MCRHQQVQPAPIADAVDQLGSNTCGSILVFDAPGGRRQGRVNFATSVVMDRVRIAVGAALAGNVDVMQLREALMMQLTIAEYQMAFVEMSKDADLHRILCIMDQKLMVDTTATWSSIAKHTIRRTVEGQDAPAVAGRAVISAVTETVALASGHVNGVCVLDNAAVALVLIGIDVYRWSRNELQFQELMVNAGENMVGCGAAVAGGMVGSSIGGVPGGLLFSFLFDLISRYAYRKGVQLISDVVCHQYRQSAVTESAAELGICLQRDSFESAKGKFRRLIIAAHPDRNHANAAEANIRAAQLIAAWQVVRGHYAQREPAAPEGEAFVVLYVMKVRDTVQSAWRVARVWLGQAENASEAAAANDLEVVIREVVYM